MLATFLQRMYNFKATVSLFLETEHGREVICD